MIDAQGFLLFLGSSLLLLAAPGPAILYVVTESVDRGRRAGVVASAGLTAGVLVHVAAATAGLSALLAASAVAFGVLKYAGAAYLIVLGVKQLRARRRGQEAVRLSTPLAARDPWSAFRRGLVVNVLNPKIALFFLAFFPQFVDPTGASTTLQFLILGVIFGMLTFAVDVGYALAAGTAAGIVRRRVRRKASRMRSAVESLPGLVYIGLGVAAAFVPVDRR